MSVAKCSSPTQVAALFSTDALKSHNMSEPKELASCLTACRTASVEQQRQPRHVPPPRLRCCVAKKQWAAIDVMTGMIGDMGWDKLGARAALEGQRTCLRYRFLGWNYEETMRVEVTPVVLSIRPAPSSKSIPVRKTWPPRRSPLAHRHAAFSPQETTPMMTSLSKGLSGAQMDKENGKVSVAPTRVL